MRSFPRIVVVSVSGVGGARPKALHAAMRSLRTTVLFPYCVIGPCDKVCMSVLYVAFSRSSSLQ